MAADTACNTTPTYEDITPPATRNIAGLKPLAFLRSRPWVNFGGMPTVKTDMASATSTFCSHIRTVSQAVLAVMSEVAQWHMRTRLYFRLSSGLSEADPFLVTTGHPSKNCRLQWYDCNIFLLFFHDLHCRLDDVCIICTWSKLWINYC